MKIYRDKKNGYIFKPCVGYENIFYMETKVDGIHAYQWYEQYFLDHPDRFEEVTEKKTVKEVMVCAIEGQFIIDYSKKVPGTAKSLTFKLDRKFCEETINMVMESLEENNLIIVNATEIPEFDVKKLTDSLFSFISNYLDKRYEQYSFTYQEKVEVIERMNNIISAMLPVASVPTPPESKQSDVTMIISEIWGLLVAFLPKLEKHKETITGIIEQVITAHSPAPPESISLENYRNDIMNLFCDYLEENGYPDANIVINPITENHGICLFKFGFVNYSFKTVLEIVSKEKKVPPEPISLEKLQRIRDLVYSTELKPEGLLVLIDDEVRDLMKKVKEAKK